MKNIISLKDSLRLKAEGFPQPDFEPGQWWFDPAERLVLACSFDRNPIASQPYRFIDPKNPDHLCFWASIESFCFAPEIQDLMEGMPYTSVLSLVFQSALGEWKAHNTFWTWPNAKPDPISALVALWVASKNVGG